MVPKKLYRNTLNEYKLEKEKERFKNKFDTCNNSMGETFLKSSFKSTLVVANDAPLCAKRLERLSSLKDSPLKDWRTLSRIQMK